MTRALFIALLLTAPATAQAQAQQHPPTGMSESSQMRHDSPKSESWTYGKPGLHLGKYGSVMVDPTVVYNGPDAQFDDIPASDRQKFANLLTGALRTELAKSFPVVAKPQANTLRLRITILGAEKTKGGLATVSRVLPVGLAVNAVKSIAGKPGKMTGSVLLALELFDGQSGELLYAAVRRRSPDALDIGATLSTSDTIKAVAEAFAKSVREKLDARI